MSTWLSRLDVSVPIIQAPMAGTSTPAMASAVTNAGGLGSIAVGAVDAASARTMIEAVRTQTTGPFNVNVFCHRPAASNPERESAWLSALKPLFESFDTSPPKIIKEIYQSFLVDETMLGLLLETKPAVVSFHFGLPSASAIARLKAEGVVLLSTATNLSDAQQAVSVGVDAVIAQGFEAGGHRGVFDPLAPDAQLGVMALTRLLVARLSVPVIAAGGMMDGAGVAAALSLGAASAQLGTAFVACPESNADQAHRQGLFGAGAALTQMTSIISGRPARCLPNRFTALGQGVMQGCPVPDYPIAYDAGKALARAASARGDGGFGAHWAGQGAPLARVMPAARLMEVIKTELADARRSSSGAKAGPA